MCTHYYDSLGNTKVLEDTEREKFNQLVQGTAASGLQCTAFAHKQVSGHECYDRKAKLEDNSLTLLGILGIMDPSQFSGDCVFTAKAIATECGSELRWSSS
ncbi:hypothetical protein POM88_026697 [Heracleum sosnowskyi]|uniref:Uncharacterized protein n=1 Tax=Heracleum sosnowskyi TaxID=360622 RepID=A0AAD8MQB6_9APIA|nr:hypothetical protein POM88_026697 [Heracleum sosnowskyi]